MYRSSPSSNLFQTVKSLSSAFAWQRALLFVRLIRCYYSIFMTAPFAFSFHISNSSSLKLCEWVTPTIHHFRPKKLFQCLNFCYFSDFSLFSIFVRFFFLLFLCIGIDLKSWIAYNSSFFFISLCALRVTYK